MSGTIYLPYYVADIYTTNFPTVAGNGTATINMNAVQLPNIPNKAYFYCRQQDSDLTINSADIYSEINNVSINYNGQAGLLSSLSEQDLYNISVKNGYQASWVEWQKACGSIFIMVFGEDLPLAPNADTQAPGLR